MKTAKLFANLTVSAFLAGFYPAARAQQGTPAQNPTPEASNAAKAHKAVRTPSAAEQAAAPVPNAAKPTKAHKAAGSKSTPERAGIPIPKGATPTQAHKGVRTASVHEQGPAPQNLEPVVSRRDPFTPLVSVPHAGGAGEHLPPGKAGLVVATVRVDGAVKSPNGMIAVVSNPDQRVYFVREGDRLYDGAVEKIGLDGVTFRENSKDAFGRPVERLVTKRIYSSAGEQQ